MAQSNNGLKFDLAANGMTEVTVSADNTSVSNEEQQVLLDKTSRTGDSCHAYRDALAALIACFGAVSIGLVLGYSNPALLDHDLMRVLQHDKEKQAWFGSLVNIGAILGCPISAVFVGKLGRKTTMMLCTLPMSAGWFLIVYGSEYILVFCGRILTGIAMGMTSVVVPMYVAEVARPEHRGILGAGFQLFVTIGILGVYTLGIPLNWNWLAVVCLSVSTVNALLLLYIPDTPRWYISQNERGLAFESLAWLLGSNENLDDEYNEIERNLTSQSTEEIKIRDFAEPGIYRPMLISFGLMFFQQMSGINAVVFYSSSIFSNAGFSSNPLIPTIIIGAVLVGANFLSCLLMDRAGRRVLLLLSGIFMTLSVTVLGVYYYLADVRKFENLSWLSLISVLVFVVSFSFGWGPIPWLVTSEIVPAKARGIIFGLATSISWALAFLITKEFQHMVDSMHSYGAFWFFGAFCLAGFVFVALFMPETKGRSLEEIQEDFSASSVST